MPQLTPMLRAIVVLVALGDSVAAARDASSSSAARSIGSLLYVPRDIYSAGDSQSGAMNAAAADEAFAEAQRAVQAGEVSLAMQHACRAVALNSDHVEARRLLGYQRVGVHWAGGFAQQMLKTGHVWRRDFGWIKSAHAANWDAGLRPWGSGWISAEEDARRHDRVERGWTVRTDHFLVTTNIDRAAGVELATRLEALYQLWRQLFGEFTLAPKDLSALADGKQAAGYLRRPFRVIYHRDRDEYNAALITRQPKIEMTLGIYFDAQRESHFFAGKDQDSGTIAHEAVHQFFYESMPRPAKNLAATANVWAVEGIACYFESLVELPASDGVRTFTIGAPDAGRTPAARHRRMVDNYYVPLVELTALGVADLQSRTDIARLYSQSAGLASFFMDFRNGVYRQPFRELLVAVYAGRDTPDKLTNLTGLSYAQLDAQYAEFMDTLPVTAVIAP